MLPLVVSAGVLLADLARPVSPEEYRRIIADHHRTTGPPARAAERRGRAYYLATCIRLGHLLQCADVPYQRRSDPESGWGPPAGRNTRGPRCRAVEGHKCSISATSLRPGLLKAS
jgi:hypothetical protein